MSGAISPLPNTPPWCDAQLLHRDNFTFIFKGKENAEDLGVDEGILESVLGK
jgi:hypothetical protein